MKLIYLIFILNLIWATGKGQKKILQIDTYKQWKTIEGGGISNDGKYAYYFLKSNISDSSIFIVKSLTTEWDCKISSVTNPKFSPDSKYIMGITNNESLFILDLTSKKKVSIPDVGNFDSFISGKKNYLVYVMQRSKILFLKDLNSQSISSYDKVEDFQVSPSGNSMLILQKESQETDILSWLELKTKNLRIIYKGKNIKGYVFDNSNSKIAFLTKENQISKIGYSCNYGLAKIITPITNEYSEIVNSSSTPLKFNNAGTALLLYVAQGNQIKSEIAMSDLQIWNYKDLYLQSQIKYNQQDLSEVKSYLSCLDMSTGKINQLIFPEEEVPYYSNVAITDDWSVVEKGLGNIHETFIHPPSISYFLRSTTGKGTITLDSNRTTPLRQITISPKGKYVIYYDSEDGNYYSYNTLTKEKINLTDKINDKLLMFNLREQAAKRIYPAGMVCWIKEDLALIYGTYDLWYLDAGGKFPPKNITNYQGERNEIIFKILPPNSADDIKWNKTIDLASFNTKTKEEGFYRLKLTENPILNKISSSPYMYFPPNFAFGGAIPNTTFIKSTKPYKYLILGQKADSFPNYYASEDLKTFSPLTNYQPQSEFNWLSSELHKYKDSLGKEYEGILYKPQNFDSTKEYPILFQYYTKQSENLNLFPNVEPVGSGFSIPIAVSRGYLVFLPDIKSTIGHPGESAVRSVLAAVKHLSSFRWADTSKMAISGHSFGGYETNYIVTQTGIFKAALSGAGGSELVSQPHDLILPEGLSWEWYYVFGPFNMGVRISDDPKLYIKNSPLLYAKNITTPLLLVHNTEDTAVPYKQSRQLFMTLRGLQKQVWWLNYEKNNHIVYQEKDVLDYNNKVFQFFDHYLKNVETPSWMVNHN